MLSPCYALASVAKPISCDRLRCLYRLHHKGAEWVPTIIPHHVPPQLSAEGQIQLSALSSSVLWGKMLSGSQLLGRGFFTPGYTTGNNDIPHSIHLLQHLRNFLGLQSAVDILTKLNFTDCGNSTNISQLTPSAYPCINDQVLNQPSPPFLSGPQTYFTSCQLFPHNVWWDSYSRSCMRIIPEPSPLTSLRANLRDPHGGVVMNRCGLFIVY